MVPWSQQVHVFFLLSFSRHLDFLNLPVHRFHQPHVRVCQGWRGPHDLSYQYCSWSQLRSAVWKRYACACDSRLGISQEIRLGDHYDVASGHRTPDHRHRLASHPHHGAENFGQLSGGQNLDHFDGLRLHAILRLLLVLRRWVQVQLVLFFLYLRR